MVPTPLSAVLLSAVLGMAVAFLVWLHRDRPAAGPLATFVIAASLWAVAKGLELAVPDIGAMAWLLRLQLTVSVVVPVAWLVTVVSYAGQPAWLTRRRFALLLVEPAVFVTLVWSTGAPGLVWSGTGTAVVGGTTTLVPAWGLAYWAHLAYTLALVLAGGAILIRTMLRSDDRFRAQATALLLAITVPTVAQGAYALDVLPVTFNPTSLGYVVSGVVLSAAILRGELLDVAPVTRDLGREVVFTELDDAVVIVDEGGRIVDSNPAAGPLFECEPAALVGEPLADHRPELAAVVPDPGTGCQTETTLERGGAARHYDVRVSPLHASYGVVTGHLISLRDVTDRRQRAQRIDVLNRLLRHDIRNEMNVVRGNADLLGDHVDGDATERVDQILDTVDRVVERSDKIGQVSEALEREQSRPILLSSLLDPVVATARETHPEADISRSEPGDVWVEGGPSLTLAFEEVVDNAARHAPSPASVAVRVETDDRSVIVRVSDDGPGIGEHERQVIESGEETPLQHGSGVGLWLVVWTVRNVGGTVSFADTDDGTTVAVELPRTEPPDDVADDAAPATAAGR